MVICGSSHRLEPVIGLLAGIFNADEERAHHVEKSGWIGVNDDLVVTFVRMVFRSPSLYNEWYTDVKKSRSLLNDTAKQPKLFENRNISVCGSTMGNKAGIIYSEMTADYFF